MARAPRAFGTLELDAAATRLLRSVDGPLEPPVRAVLFGAARFGEHGRSLARAQAVAGPGEARGSFFPRLQQNLLALRDARAVLEDHSRKGHHLAPAAGWLIDHGHLLDGQLDTVRNGLPRRYYAQLPRLRDAPLAGLPRVYGLAWAWVAHTDSGLDEDLLGQFLAAYQSERELTLAELWAIPTTLRVVLVENLRRLAERAAATQTARDVAQRLIEAGAQGGDDALLQSVGHTLAERGVLEAFALQLYGRSDEVAPDAGVTLRRWLGERLPDPAGALQRQQQQAAEDHQSVRNAVTSLRALDRTDWRAVLLQPSAALASLQGLPVFTAESEATQDLTLHDVEHLARHAAIPESTVSEAVAGLATGRSGAASAPMHWLRGPGQSELLAALGLPDAWPRRWRVVKRAAVPAYLLTIGGISAALVAVVMRHDASVDLYWPAWMLTAWLLAFPASEAVLAVLHRVISESLPPHRLPRMALQGGIPIEHRPLVVVPALLTSVRGTVALAAQLEQHHLANPEVHAQFALLTDLPDATLQHAPQDAALLQAAHRAVEQLNRRHGVPASGPQRFLLLHRERCWSDSEQCWMGWERKRGKLEAVLIALVEGGASPFIDLGALSTPAPGIRYLVTLDSDTDMPPGRLRELVAVAAHPINAPVIDPQTRRVTAGYTILQPRIVVPLPEPGARTPFHWLFSGQWGIDPYSAASSEVYQDLFGEGTFTGKGLLDVRGAHATLAHRLPDAQLLSHDLLEGALGRFAAVSDITLVEDAPAHPDVAAARLHRWIRGDWQLLPFLLHPGRWPMAGINRWKMIDNLRRSLVAPASLALLVWVMATGALPVSSALWLVAAAWSAGPLLGAVAALAPPRDDISLRLFYQHTLPQVARAIAGALWHGVQLTGQALTAADAVLRALVRQYVSRRRMLQWTTAAAAQAAAATTWPAMLRRHRRSVGLALCLLSLLAALRAVVSTDVPAFWPVLLCLLWAVAPAVTWLAARPRVGASQRLDEPSLDRLRTVARDTWSFLARVGTDDHHLPPDNVQLSGAVPMVAHRTSPTNIGLYLLSVAAAREMDFIDDITMIQRLEATLDTLELLPRWNGHFYNWYDTKTLAVLAPAYVSSVDSGNLCGHLLVLAASCEQRSARPDGATIGDTPAAARLLRLASRARSFALAADFKVLYDPRHMLLHIGYDVDSQKLDAGHYDLLASEARLASLVAIAKGDVPPRHWAALGRPLFAALEGGSRQASVGLKSWSGSMFEYLMPSLVLEEPDGSLLFEATRTAVALQCRDGAAHGTPWGVSESAIAAQDHTLAYQYGPQGVAALALRRTPVDERVVAPYASLMALVVAPQAAVENLAALERLGARGAFGFIESLDYTPRRQPAGAQSDHTMVRTYMAHHQAMGLLACAHVLTGGAVRRWAAAAPHLRAVLSLLHERATHEAPLPRETSRPAQSPALTGQRWRYDTDPQTRALAPSHVIGNERYAVMLRAGGAGCSQWQGQSLTAGRGGWSWYTGAASWLQRAALESICRLRWHRDQVRLEPCLPPHCPRVEIDLEHAGRTVRVIVTRSAADNAGGSAIHLRRGETVGLGTLADDAVLMTVVGAPLAAHPAGTRDTGHAGASSRAAGSTRPGSRTASTDLPS
jgi:cyclic beta-1,2-glucan synthetase